MQLDKNYDGSVYNAWHCAKITLKLFKSSSTQALPNNQAEPMQTQ